MVFRKGGVSSALTVLERCDESIQFTDIALTHNLHQLYTPGPGESLNNYEVHLKNRKHILKVQARLNGMYPS